MKRFQKRFTAWLLMFIMIFGMCPVEAQAASYKGTVTLYGTPEAAIKKGPTYGSKVTIDLGTRTGQSWNNVSYTIPQVGEYFELNDGWTINYVSVAGNSSGNRQPGASFLLSMSGGSMVYYFKQTAVSKNFTLSYNANGGSGAPAQQTATSTESSHNFTISKTKPTRSGYTFLGWSTSSTATSPSCYGGGTINVTGARTLYAVWKKNSEQVTLTYMDRTLYATDTQEKGSSFTIRNCTNTRKNYEFKGWDENSTATDVVYEPEDVITLDSNTTVYAVWQLKAPVDNGNGIEIKKTRKAINDDPNKTTAEAGDEITWSIKVTNNSNVTKTVNLTEKLTGASLSESTIIIPAGETKTVTATYTVKGVDSGKLYNTVIGETDKPDEKKEVTDDGTDIKKEANYRVEWYDTDRNSIKTPETRKGQVSEEVSVKNEDKAVAGYTFDENNTGNILSATLKESGTVLCLYFTKTPVDNGKGIEIEKTRKAVNGDSNKSTAEAGDEITWSIKVTNNSNVTKTVNLTEKLTGASLSESTIIIPAGETKTVTATYTVKSTDSGKLYNTVIGETDKPDEKKEATDDGTDIKKEASYRVEWYDTDRNSIKTPETRKGQVSEEVSVKNGNYSVSPGLSS